MPRRQILKVVGAHHLHEGDQHAADDRAEERAHAADDDDDESVDHDGGAHAEKRRDQRGGKHAAERGERAAEAEHSGAHQVDVGAERMHHLGVLRDRADQEAGAGALEELPDGDRGGDPEGDQEQPIERKRLVEDDDDAAQEIRDAGAERLHAPDQPDHLAQHHGEPEGEQQIGAAVAAAVEVAQQGPLEHHADEPDHDRRDHERDQEAAGEHVRRVADIGAEHENDAVREIDDAHDAEDQRQPTGDEEQDRGLRERIEALRQDEAEPIHRTLSVRLV